MGFLIPALISGAATLFGANKSAKAAKSAAQTQASAANEAARLQAESAKEVARMQIEAADKAYERQLAERKPLQEMGLAAMRRIQAGFAEGGEFARPFQMGDVLGSERYKTLLEAGTGALEQSAFSRGMGVSTPTAINVTNLGQKLGVTEYDTTLNQLRAERESQLRGLEYMSNIGAGQTGAIANLAGQTALAQGAAGAGAAGSIGTTAANAIMAGAGASAAGQVQAGNIWGGALSNIGGQTSQLYVLNSLLNRPAASNVPVETRYPSIQLPMNYSTG